MEKLNKKGTIVVVIEGRAMGHPADTITKVLSKPGTVDDRAACYSGMRIWPELKELLLCEDMIQIYDETYLNKPCLYEYNSDLRPATEEEKFKYHKSKQK